MNIPQGGSSCTQFPGRIGIWNVRFCGGRRPKNLENNPLKKDENQQKIQPTCDTRFRN